MNGRQHIGRAWKIASELEAEGYSQAHAGAILAMALGIYMEGKEDSHRNLEPLTESMTRIAQMAFDAIREDRLRKGGLPDVAS